MSSSYEANMGGLGVGKRFGPLDLGGVGGVTCGVNGEYRFVAEISAGELASAAAISFQLPEGYGLITSVRVETEEAFGAGDVVDVAVDAVDILTAPAAVTTLGIADAPIGALEPLDGTNVVTINTAGIDSGSDTGFAKVIVTVERV